MKLVYSFTFTVLVSLFTLTTYAQKCKLDKDEADPFTKEHVKSGKAMIGKTYVKWSLTLNNISGKYGWEMTMGIGGHIEEVLQKGSIIYCKLENEKVIQLVLNNDYIPMHSVVNGTIITYYTPKGDLDEGAIKVFAESPLIGVRATIAGNNIEPVVTDKQGNLLQNIARCLLLP